jgi:hypothetical protein
MAPGVHQWLWVLWVWLVPGRAVIVMTLGCRLLRHAYAQQQINQKTTIFPVHV